MHDGPSGGIYITAMETINPSVESITAAALPYIIEQKSGQIIDISSINGHTVLHYQKACEWRLNPYNIRMTVISAGAIATELRDSISDK